MPVIRRIKRWAYWVCVWCLKVVPVSNNKMVFTSFNGHYTDSPKYISQEIRKQNPNVRIVWLVKKAYWHNLPSDVEIADFDNAMQRLYHTATAKVLVDNTYAGKTVYLEKTGTWQRLRFLLRVWRGSKRGQKIYTTWHGTPLKRMGRHQIGSHMVDFKAPNMTMLLGNRYTKEIMQDIAFGKLPVQLLGTPRNDSLFCPEKQAQLKEKLGLPADKKVVLFAPTFRNDSDGIVDTNVGRSGLNQLNELPFDWLAQVLQQRFGGEWIFVCRFHYMVEAQVPWQQLQQKYPGQLFNGNLHEDMAQYLCCTDLLITDASSSMFDFMLTYKPCVLYFPDLEHYKTVERGFYREIESLPFPVATTPEDLLEAVGTMNEEAYRKAVEALIAEFGYVDDRDSAKRIAAYILRECNLQGE